MPTETDSLPITPALFADAHSHMGSGYPLAPSYKGISQFTWSRQRQHAWEEWPALRSLCWVGPYERPPGRRLGVLSQFTELHSDVWCSPYAEDSGPISNVP